MIISMIESWGGRAEGRKGGKRAVWKSDYVFVFFFGFKMVGGRGGEMKGSFLCDDKDLERRKGVGVAR